MLKKLKKWLFNKYFIDEFEDYIILIKNQNDQINNLKKQINFLTMKGPML